MTTVLKGSVRNGADYPADTELEQQFSFAALYDGIKLDAMLVDTGNHRAAVPAIEHLFYDADSRTIFLKLVSDGEWPAQFQPAVWVTTA